LEPLVPQLREEAGIVAFLVMGECDRSWKHIESFDKAVNACPTPNDTLDLLSEQVNPEDNATIIFTSGILADGVYVATPLKRLL